MKIKYGGRGRDTHSSFIEYMKKIANHSNYADMPWGVDDVGKIRWNAPSHRPPGGKWSNLHDERLQWWKKKAKDLLIPLQGNWISVVAKKIHPYKKKPCQICGVERSLFYEYPTKNCLRKINKITGLSKPFNYNDFRTIKEIAIEVEKQVGKSGLASLCKILAVPDSLANSLPSLISFIKNVVVPAEPKGLLSPGAMSNAPDRLDGFHTYNICCRPSQDTGRSADNLRTYGLDRRAFEFWCEGDWAAASRVMRHEPVGNCGICRNTSKLTADHVGPLSLGFCHRPKFNALCKACNSGKNNRMTKSDVLSLRRDEMRGEKVVSFYAKKIWDLGKRLVKNNDNALYLSKLMRVNQHHYLMLLAKIKNAGYVDFLKSLLHLEYAKNRYDVIGFSRTDFSFKKLRIEKRQPTYSASMIKRIERISLDALNDYISKGNRNPLLIDNVSLKNQEKKVFDFLKQGNYDKAKIELTKYMDMVGIHLFKKGIPRAYMKKMNGES